MVRTLSRNGSGYSVTAERIFGAWGERTIGFDLSAVTESLRADRVLTVDGRPAHPEASNDAKFLSAGFWRCDAVRLGAHRDVWL